SGGKSVLEITAAAAASGLSAAGYSYVSLSQITNFSLLQIDFSAIAKGSGSANLSFDTLVNQGRINLISGDRVTFGAVVSTASPGTINLRSGGLVHFQGAVAANQTVLFNPSGGTAVIDQPGQFAGTIGNFATFDFIDLATAAFSSAGTVNLAAGNVLKVSENGTTYSLQLDPAQSFAGATFHLANDGAGGTDITVGAGAAFGVTTPLMTNTGGDFDFDQVVGGQMVYTRLGGLGPEWEFGGNGFLFGDGNAGFLIRNTGNVAPGALYVGEVVGGLAAYTALGGLGSEWHFAGN